MAALAIGAAATVVARSFVGVRTIGVFAPALLAVMALQLGPRVGLTTLVLGAAAGLAALPLVQALALPRTARLGLVVCAICLAVTLAVPADDAAVALPVVVLAVLVERTWDVTASDGVRSALRLLGGTCALAAVIVLVLLLPPVQVLVADGVTAIVLSATVMLLAGSYRGLRVGERRRFRQLLTADRTA
jgi:hypothetical protein